MLNKRFGAYDSFSLILSILFLDFLHLKFVISELILANSRSVCTSFVNKRLRRVSH